MDDSSSNNMFCTMGAMMMTENNYYGNNQHFHHRKLWETYDHPQHMHGINHVMDDHDHSSMNHDDHSAMNHDHSSHQMPSMGTIMFMDGFHSALFPSSPQSPPPCLNFLHPSWTLHTQSKFIFAMICVTVMGILVEGFGVWRVKCLRKGRHCRREERRKSMEMRLQEEQNRQQNENQMMNSLISEITLDTARTIQPKGHLCPVFLRRIWRRIVPKFIRGFCAKLCAPCCRTSGYSREGSRKIRRYEFAAALLHALRACVGYLLMLAVMTYAVEFLVCTVVGMVFGRFLFVDMEGGGDAVGVGVGGGIGGMGLGGGGGGDGGVSLRGVESPARGSMLNDGMEGTWGGGDPCCGIDDDDDDQEYGANDVRDPLLGNFPDVLQNSGVARRNNFSGGERG